MLPIVLCSPNTISVAVLQRDTHNTSLPTANGLCRCAVVKTGSVLARGRHAAMWHYGWHMGGMWLGWVVLLFVVAVAVWAIVALASPRVPLGGPEDPETALKRRYARGEIDREEYQRRLEDLRR